MTRHYFGTDGIRGRVGESPITADFMLKLGWAAGRELAGRAANNQVLIGKDTRLSNYMFESALEAGLSSAGVNIQLLGPLPTPAIAYLTRTLRANAGIVISASHNPHHDNGIKFFSPTGHKLDDDTESAIERRLEGSLTTVGTTRLGKAFRMEDARGRYIEFCKHSLRNGTDLQGLKLVVDCANGAAYQVAPAVFHELGAEVHRIGCEPDGVNINVDCGALHPESLATRVRQLGADAGVALDGDGDRLIMVDSDGVVRDGDELLWVIANERRDENGLDGPVVGTQMTNLGLELALGRLNVPLVRARVGDRYVLEQMLAYDAQLGGETSGHIVCSDRTTTGDGIVSALQVLGRMVKLGCGLAELTQGMQLLPQHMVNVPLEARVSDPLTDPRVRDAVSNAESYLGASGRVLLRPSGTEPVVRVMVEGENDRQVRELAEGIAAEAAASLGRSATAN